MLKRIVTYLKSSSSFLPLALILYFSPLPPLTTLLYLSRLNVFECVPRGLADPEELRRQGYAEEFVKLYEEVLLAQRTGRREGLRNVLEKALHETRTSLEMMDYNVSTMMEVLSLVTIVIPTLLASVAVFVDPSMFVPVIVASSALGAVVALVMGVYSIPSELWLRRPRLVALAPLLLFLPAFYLAGSTSLALMTAALAASIPILYEQRKALKVLSEAVELLSRASHSSNPVLAGVSLDSLLDGRFYGIARAATITLYTLFTQGGSKYYEGVAKLLAYVREYASMFRGIRRKALQSFAYALVMAAMAAAAMAIVIAVIDFMAGMPLGDAGVYAGLRVPSKEETSALKAGADMFLALSALAYAIAVACMRDGNPLYFPLYLAAILPTSYLSFHLSLRYAPALLGVGA